MGTGPRRSVNVRWCSETTSPDWRWCSSPTFPTRATVSCSTSDDLQLHGGVGEAEDRAVLAIASLKALQNWQPDQVPVEPDCLVVVGAGTTDAQRPDRKMLGPASSSLGSVGHAHSLCGSGSFAATG